MTEKVADLLATIEFQREIIETLSADVRSAASELFEWQIGLRLFVPSISSQLGHYDTAQDERGDYHQRHRGPDPTGLPLSVAAATVGATISRWRDYP